MYITLPTKKYLEEKRKLDFKKAKLILVQTGKILGRTLAKLFRLIIQVIKYCILLFVIAHFVPELREKMPALFKLSEVILEEFDNWLMGTKLMANWF